MEVFFFSTDRSERREEGAVEEGRTAVSRVVEEGRMGEGPAVDANYVNFRRGRERNLMSEYTAHLNKALTDYNLLPPFT